MGGLKKIKKISKKKKIRKRKRRDEEAGRKEIWNVQGKKDKDEKKILGP